MSVPMMPLAPGLFSIMMVCLSKGPRPWANLREIMSVPPPAEYGTMMRIGLVGQLAVWAWATDGPAASKPAAATTPKEASN